MRTSSFLLVVFPALLSAQGTPPGVLRVRADAQSGDSVVHTTMPPGWHVTTGPGALLFEPTQTARGRFVLTLEVHLFPGKSQEGFGVFLGGTGLDGREPSYVRFVARRDGQAAIERVRGTTIEAVRQWQSNDAVKPHPGTDDTAFNTLIIRAENDSVRFEANGKPLMTVPRSEVAVDGVFGIRVGADVNLHVTNLDHTVRYAPGRGTRR